MRIFLRAVITGFGWSLGAALYKRVSDQLEARNGKKEDPVANQAAAGAPSSVDQDSDGVVDGEPPDRGQPT